MSRTPHRTPFENAAYNPSEVKEDERVQCSVCGFAGIDPDRTQEPEQAVYAVVTSGTYALSTGTSFEDFGRQDVYYGDTTPPTGAPAHTTNTNVGVFFGDSDPPANAPMHTADNRPVFFNVELIGPAPLYVQGITDFDAFTQIGIGAGCPFCGSPNWSWAREPDLRW